MLVKEISVKNGDYFIRDSVYEYKTSNTAKLYWKDQKAYDKGLLDYYERNAKAGLLKYDILEV